MNQNTTGVNFELTGVNNRSKNLAKKDIFLGTANYITTEILFHWNDGWSFERKAFFSFMYGAKMSTYSKMITLFEKFFLMIYR